MTAPRRFYTPTEMAERVREAKEVASRRIEERFRKDLVRFCRAKMQDCEKFLSTRGNRSPYAPVIEGRLAAFGAVMEYLRNTGKVEAQSDVSRDRRCA